MLKTTTDANGFYSFGNLLLDENYRRQRRRRAEPTFIDHGRHAGGLRARPAEPGRRTTPGLGQPSGEPATVTKGTTNNTYDFGFVRQRRDRQHGLAGRERRRRPGRGRGGHRQRHGELCNERPARRSLATTVHRRQRPLPLHGSAGRARYGDGRRARRRPGWQPTTYDENGDSDTPHPHDGDADLRRGAPDRRLRLQLGADRAT